MVKGGAAIEPTIIFLIVSGVYVGWNIGANDTANCIGTTVGCGLISFKRAAMLAAVFAVFGAVFQGHEVMKTVGKGIVKSDLDSAAVLAALLCSGFFVTLATFFRIPTSTSQAIVGGVLGIGLAAGSEIDYSKFFVIVQSWVLCPFLVMALSYIFSRFLGLILPRLRLSGMLLRNTIGWLAIVSSCYLAFAMGANNAGNAVGPITNLGLFDPMLLLGLAGFSIAIGAVSYGKKVTDTIGKGITQLDIPAAFAAQLSSALGMHFFSILGIPVSTSSAIVGAVVGVGLVKGARAVSGKSLLIIFAGWVLTPALAAAGSYMLYNLIVTIF